MTRNSVKETLRTLPVQESIVYGPIHSTRLGLSLGINLLPSSYKLCSFNCVYCQYGYTSKPTLDVSKSLFIQGRITNADPNSVEHWVEKVKEIQPVLVQVYSLDRAPADMRLSKVNRPTLEWIASQVRWRAGVKAEIY